MDEELKQDLETKKQEIEALNATITELNETIANKDAEIAKLKESNERFNDTIAMVKAEADAKLEKREQELKNEITERDNVIKQLFENGESKPQESSVDRVLNKVNANRNYNY